MESAPKNNHITADDTQEPDWDLFDYMIKVEKEWSESLRATLPKTPSEWLKVFPEAKAVIPQKIAEWEAVASEAKVHIKRYLLNIESESSDELKELHRTIFKYLSPDVKNLAIAKRRIRALSIALPTSGRASHRKWQVALQQAKGRDLLEVAEHCGFHPRKAGKTYRMLCPFHTERTPSFHIYPPSRFVCFGCDTKGDTINFIMLLNQSSCKEAVFKLQTI